MAKDIQRGDLVAALQRRYGLVGRTGFVLDEVIVPTVALDDLTEISTPELAVGRASVSPAAGEFSVIELANDQGAGNLLRVRRVMFTVSTNAATLTGGFSGVGLPAAVVGLSRYQDRRIDRIPPATVRGQSIAALPALDQFFDVRVLQERIWTWEPEAVFIPEGFVLRFQTQTPDTPLKVNYEWEEIPPELVA